MVAGVAPSDETPEGRLPVRKVFRKLAARAAGAREGADGVLPRSPLTLIWRVTNFMSSRPTSILVTLRRLKPSCLGRIINNANAFGEQFGTFILV